MNSNSENPKIPHASPGQDGLHKAGTFERTVPIFGDQPATDHFPACAPVASGGGESERGKGVQPEREIGDPVKAGLKHWAALETQDPAIVRTAAEIGFIGARLLVLQAIEVLEDHAGEDVEEVTRQIVECVAEEQQSAAFNTCPGQLAHDD